MKNKKMSFLAVLVMLVTITTYSVSGTYAKYTSTGLDKSDVARVAKWDITVGGTKLSSFTADTTFDLFKNVKDLDADGELSTAETDIASTATNGLVAPGTGGKADFVIKNNSEVRASYTVTLTDVINAGGIPLEFKGQTSKEDGTVISTGNWVKINATLDESALTATKFSGELEIGETKVISVYWRWQFGDETGIDTADKSSTDTADTALGDAGSATVQVKAKLVATQIN